MFYNILENVTNGLTFDIYIEKKGERKMAIPIKETPILKGKDAAFFIKKANSPIKVTSNVRKRVFENYSKFKEIAKYK